MSEALERSLCYASTMLRRVVTIFGCCGVFVVLIFVAEERLVTLVLISPLQVCSYSSSLNISLNISSAVPLTQGPLQVDLQHHGRARLTKFLWLTHNLLYPLPLDPA